MSDESDPIARTEMFRRFTDQPQPAEKRNPTLLIGLVVLALVLAGVVVWLAA